MKRIYILLLALALTAGCTAKPQAEQAGTGNLDERSKPPALTVLVGEGEVPAALGTYSWTWSNGNGTDTCVEADSLHPLDMLDYLTPLSLGSERRLTLRFDLDGHSLDRLTIRRWDLSCAGNADKYESDFDMLSCTVEDGLVAADLPDGRDGIFEVHAYFTGDSHGDAYYAFFLQGRIDKVLKAPTKTVRIVWRAGLSKLPQGQVVCSRTKLEDALAGETLCDGGEAITVYDDGYFEEHELVLVLMESGSGSVSHQVMDVLTSPSGVTVTVHRMAPEICTADMAAWLMLVDLPAGTALEDTPVTVKII